jgi:hypothetical protein
VQRQGLLDLGVVVGCRRVGHGQRIFVVASDVTTTGAPGGGAAAILGRAGH